MAQMYSAYEAKARFSEVLRRVKAGQRIIITYRDQEVAEIRPVPPKSSTLEQRLARLEEEGMLSRSAAPGSGWKPLVRRPGAVARFLESRE